MSREFTVSPIGLLTQPNKIGVYPQGAMERADGLCMRAPGKLTPFRVPTGFVNRPVLSNGTSSICVFPTGGSKIFLAASTTGQANVTNLYLGDSVTQVLTTLTSIESQFSSRARCLPLLFRGRIFVLTTTGLTVLDALDGTDTTFRWSQLPQPTFIVGTGNSGSTIPIVNGTAVAYATVLRRTFADGYELVSAPSPIQRVKNNGVLTGGLQLFCGIPKGTRGGVAPGDVLELYRSRSAPSVGSGLATDPGTTLYMVASQVLDATIIANGNLFIRDLAAADQVVGRELYTNPGQETLQSARFIPPTAKCVADFKGFVFYANVLQPGAWVAAFPSGLGNLSTVPTRAEGIGTRSFAGTFAAGNAVVTAISAADMVGLKVGQGLSGSLISGGFVTSSGVPTVTIIAVGANQITMSIAATGTGASTAQSFDAVEVDAFVGFIGDMSMAVYTLAHPLSAGGDFYNITADESLGYREAPFTAAAGQLPGLTFGQQIQFTPYRAIQNSYGISVRATNGANYRPPLPELSTTAAQTFPATRRMNLLEWSWEQQPESVSPSTYAFIGSGEIYQLATTRDVMWIFASDGLWRFSGYGTRPSGIQANFRVDLIDKTLILAGPNAFAVLRDAVFAYTNIGLVKISDAGGVQPITRGVIGDLLPGRYWIEDDDISMAADEVLDEVWINITTGNFEGGTGVSSCFVWSETYGVFTKLAQNVGPNDVLQQLAFDRFQGLVVQGVGSSNTNVGPATQRHDPAVASFNAWTADYQPQYGPDPMSSKQWGGMIVVTDPASAGKSITPRFNGVAYASNPLVLYPNTKDARANFGVDIDAPAWANSLQPGLSGAAETTITELRAIAMQYEPIDEQQVFR